MYKYIGYIDKSGHLEQAARDSIAGILEDNAGHKAEINIQILTKKAKVGYYRYYHGVLLPEIAKVTGYDVEELNMLAKKKFLGWDTREIDDEIIQTLISLKSLDNNAMRDFVQMVEAWAVSNFGIELDKKERK